MIQYILVITIIAAALVYAAIRLFSTFKNVGKGDVCSGCEGCGHKNDGQGCRTKSEERRVKSEESINNHQSIVNKRVKNGAEKMI